MSYSFFFFSHGILVKLYCLECEPHLFSFNIQNKSILFFMWTSSFLALFIEKIVLSSLSPVKHNLAVFVKIYFWGPYFVHFICLIISTLLRTWSSMIDMTCLPSVSALGRLWGRRMASTLHSEFHSSQSYIKRPFLIYSYKTKILLFWFLFLNLEY